MLSSHLTAYFQRLFSPLTLLGQEPHFHQFRGIKTREIWTLYETRVCLFAHIASGWLDRRSTNCEEHSTMASNPAFSKLTDQFVKESLALSPVAASYTGYHKYTDPKTDKVVNLDAELDDVSGQGVAAQQAFYTAWRARFKSETPIASLGDQHAADYRLIDDNVALALLEYDHIQSDKHQPQIYVEIVGMGLFLPLTQDYASKEVRFGHVISRIGQIPRSLEQAKSVLTDAETRSSFRRPWTRMRTIST